MASAYEQLAYDTSKPMTFDDWQDQATSKDFDTGNFWKDFGNGLTKGFKLLNPNDKDYGRKGYESYLEQFYQDQDTRNSAISEANQKKFEEYMSSTAYQRAYKDILKTGLNPNILLSSAFGPASTPSSSVAYTRRSSNTSSHSQNESRSFSASSVLAAVLLLLGKMML